MQFKRGTPTTTLTKENFTQDNYWYYYHLLNLNNIKFTYQFMDSQTLSNYEKQKLFKRAKKLGYDTIR